MTTPPARPSTRCAICDEPRADHGFTAVADRDGRLGPWHDYTPKEYLMLEPRPEFQALIDAFAAEYDSFIESRGSSLDGHATQEPVLDRHTPS